jgi:hypothetical protein
MNHIHRILAAAATLAGALLALTTASAAYASLPPHGGGPVGAPATFGQPYPPPGQLSKYEPVAHHFNGVSGAMTGWQVALIAVGAAIVGAAMAVLIDHARMARKMDATTA